MKKRMVRNIPLSMPDDLLKAVDIVSGISGESRSLTMRKAIAIGLPTLARVAKIQRKINADVLKVSRKGGRK